MKQVTTKEDKHHVQLALKAGKEARHYGLRPDGYPGKTPEAATGQGGLDIYQRIIAETARMVITDGKS